MDTWGEVHPAKMNIGPDNLLYFTGGTNNRAYRVDVDGNTEVFAELPVDIAIGFTLGCQFDAAGNYYMVNGKGVFRVPADQVTGSDTVLPVIPELFFEWPTDPETAVFIPMVIDIDTNNNVAYVSDMGRGDIWKIDLDTGVGAVWVSSQDGKDAEYGLLKGYDDSTNFLGVPFGLCEVMVDATSEWLYFSAHERNYFGRIKIEPNGDAGAFQMLDEVEGNAALNGAFLDKVNNKLYGAAPFLNFENGVERNPKSTRGGEIWMLDLDDVAEDGSGGKAVRILSNPDAYGTLTDVITGYGFKGANDCDLYMLDGSFDTLEWPTGVIPDPDAAYHAAVRKFTPEGCGSS